MAYEFGKKRITIGYWRKSLFTCMNVNFNIVEFGGGMYSMMTNVLKIEPVIESKKLPIYNSIVRSMMSYIYLFYILLKSKINFLIKKQ